MPEKRNERVHSESVVLNIGQDLGALIIYTEAELRGREIEVSPRGDARTRTHVEVLERRINGRPFSPHSFRNSARASTTSGTRPRSSPILSLSWAGRWRQSIGAGDPSSFRAASTTTNPRDH